MDPFKPPLVQRAIPTDPAVRSSSSLFLTETAGQAGEATRQLLFSGPAPAHPSVVELMGVEPGEQVLSRRRLMLVDGVPVRIATSYFLPEAPEAAELTGDDFVPGGLQELFERHGRVFARAAETLVARLPAGDEAELLAIDPAEPVVEIVRSSYDREGQPVHTLQTICAASRHVFVIGQPPEDEAF